MTTVKGGLRRPENPCGGRAGTASAQRLKICARCGVEKLRDCFWRKQSCADGFDATCSACRRAALDAYRKGGSVDAPRPRRAKATYLATRRAEKARADLATFTALVAELDTHDDSFGV